MNRTAQRLLFAGLVIVFASMAYAFNYMYVTHDEMTVFGDRIKFMSGDTLTGPVRSNGQIAIMGSPVFYDFVITTAADFWHGPGYSPGLPGPPPVFNAPFIPFPQRVDTLRARAIAEGHYINQGDTMQARIQLGDHTMRLWWAELGAPFDTTEYEDYPLTDTAVVFFECPEIRIFGTVHTTLIFAASGRIGLEDNVLYASSDPVHGQLNPNHTEKLALVSENEIKILNTWANGRENSSQGSDIALNGHLVALNESFTFENQNDPDSGYDYGSQDDRGTIYLWGAVTQKRRGYVHRSTRGSTGYLRQYQYDEAIRHWDLSLFNLRENSIEPPSLNFGTVTVGDTVSDTLRVSNDYIPVRISNVLTTANYHATLSDTTQWFTHWIAVRFAPTHAGEVYGELTFMLDSVEQSVGLFGVGVNPSAALAPQLMPNNLSLQIFPNPFNLSTEIRYTLPKAGDTKIILFDVLGRNVRTLELTDKSAGAHTLRLNAEGMASGVYFVRLESGEQQQTVKVMLMK
jgi:hypothetical protein